MCVSVFNITTYNKMKRALPPVFDHFKDPSDKRCALNRFAQTFQRGVIIYLKKFTNIHKLPISLDFDKLTKVLVPARKFFPYRAILKIFLGRFFYIRTSDFRTEIIFDFLHHYFAINYWRINID